MDTKNINKQTYLSFCLAEETFAVSVYKVLEVLEIQHITKLPRTPKYVRGMIDFRGEVIPVIDTRLKFKMENREDTAKTVIIVLELLLDEEEEFILGILADSVKDVIEVDASEIKKIPDAGSRYSSNYVKGMIHGKDYFTIILDIDKIFSAKDIQLLNERIDDSEWEWPEDDADQSASESEKKPESELEETDNNSSEQDKDLQKQTSHSVEEDEEENFDDSIFFQQPEPIEKEDVEAANSEDEKSTNEETSADTTDDNPDDAPEEDNKTVENEESESDENENSTGSEEETDSKEEKS